MARGNSESSSELIQIVILTLSMTGAGFLLLYLGLKFYMVPKIEKNVRTANTNYENLAKFLEGEEMQALREKAEEQKKSEKQSTLAQIVEDNRKGQNLQFASQNTDSKDKKTVIEEIQKLKLKEAPMRRIMEFVARVGASKPSVRVENLQMQRKRTSRNAEPEDLWTASVTFVEFKPPK